MEDGVSTALRPGDAVGNGVDIIPCKCKSLVSVAASATSFRVDTRQVDLVSPVHKICDDIRQSKGGAALRSRIKIKRVAASIASQCICAASTGQHVVPAVAGDYVTQRVAGTVDIVRTGQSQVLNVTTQSVADA